MRLAAAMQLFHFSESPDIELFVPRPVAVPSPRREGMDWLNGPLVWAIDAWHQPLYLFPRDCPRILAWPTPQSTAEDRRAFGDTRARMIAYIEERWSRHHADAILHRYALPGDGFECLDDAGMWVSRSTVSPREVQPIADLPAALDAADVELRIVPTLGPIKALFATSLHVSGVRLRNMGLGPPIR